MYTFNSRARYSETDEYGQLSLVGIINYMQDCSTSQSKGARMGVEYLDNNHKTWFLSSWQITIDRHPRLGKKLVMGTWHCSFKGIYGYRNFVLLDGEGRHLVRAGSVWFLYDTEKNTPIRVYPEDAVPYGKAEAPLTLNPAPRKIPMSDHYDEGKPIVVARHYIDTNHHVNNTQCVGTAREPISEGLRIREVRADYKRAAALGNVVIPRISQGSAYKQTVSSDDSVAQDTYAVVWLQTEPQMQEKPRQTKDQREKKMIELGKVQELEILRTKDFGVYVGEQAEDEPAVLLPKKQVSKGAKIGDKVKVFIYKDSLSHLVATTGVPKLQVGETAILGVKDMAKMGAFLDMGLEKDLLLPFKEQTHPVRKRERCLVTLYADKSKRLVATMWVYSHMSNQSPYKEEDWVTDTIYEINGTIGAFVAVDNKYYGLIPKKELFGKFGEGDTVQARVTKVRKGGKLDLCARERAYVQMGMDAEAVLKVMDEFDGVLPFNDRANPDVIMRRFHVNKDAFKRAVRRLLKEGKVRVTEKTVRRI